MKIDVHNHFYPEGFLRLLDREGKAAGIHVETDDWGRQLLVQNGNRLVTLTPAMTDVDTRIEDMETAGIDTQVLTLSIPSVDIFPPALAVEMAMAVNDEMADICRAHPDHFMAFATLPFAEPESAVEELNRCIRRHGFCGACIGTNINHMPLDDKSLYPFYEAISAFDLPVHIHPRAPRDRETYRDYRLGPMIGFEMELCVAVVRLIMGGVMDRFPQIQFIVSHLGGAIPYLAERIQNCYEAYPECQENVSGPVRDYLKRFTYDTVSFFEPALLCAHAFAGADQLILGSDYPHVIGDIDEAVTSIETLPIPAEDKEKIYSGNFLRLTHRDR